MHTEAVGQADVVWSRITGLDRVMAVCDGDPSITIGLLDGPVDSGNPGFAEEALVTGAAVAGAAITRAHTRSGDTAASDGAATQHGTAVAGVLAARRSSGAPAICPGCRVLVRPVLADGDEGHPVARPEDLAAGIAECLAAGVRLINLSAGFTTAGSPQNEPVRSALDLAARRGVIVVVAAGNGGSLGGSSTVSHPSVVPVTSCDETGRPLPGGNLGISVGRRGVRAPGTPVESLGPRSADLGRPLTTLSGTSLSTAFVTGALALAWSAAPGLPGAVLQLALTGARSARRGIVPPLLDAVSLYRAGPLSTLEHRP
ncbi:S8 family serine peptidase [Streptomyces pathocidini]|uniref:S8 family serine peptidase n=1 Tax=Streptomyces pathocidini TaxID=1650571 RepID=UPI0033C90CB0